VGMTNMKAMLKDDKGSTVWEHITLEELAYPMFVIKNWEEVWRQMNEVRVMEPEERAKYYKEYKTLETTEKRKSTSWYKVCLLIKYILPYCYVIVSISQ